MRSWPRYSRGSLDAAATAAPLRREMDLRTVPRSQESLPVFPSRARSSASSPSGRTAKLPMRPRIAGGVSYAEGRGGKPGGRVEGGRGSPPMLRASTLALVALVASSALTLAGCRRTPPLTRAAADFGIEPAPGEDAP